MLRGVTAEWRDPDSATRLRERAWPRQFNGSVEQIRIYRELLREELQQGVVKLTSRDQVAWANPTFIVPKKCGGGRKILDCSILNEFVKDRSFRMEDAAVVCQLAQANDWATTVDISSAYLHVGVEEELQPFLSFEFDSQWYRYTCMPFGLKHAPRVFTLIMRKVVEHLRTSLKARLVIYMDDILILGEGCEQTARLTKAVVTELLLLGWTVSLEKSHLQPVQIIEFLGWEFNFQSMTLRTTASRRRELIQALKSYQSTAAQRLLIPIKQLASLIGSLNFLRLQHTQASLYLVRLNETKTRGVKQNGWNASIRLTPLILGEVKWWLRTLTHNTAAPLRVEQPGATLTTDASPWGWGACLELPDREKVRAWDTWTVEQQGMSSNHKEFLAILLALDRLQRQLNETRAIRVLTDNTSTAYNIQRWRGVRRRIPALRQLWNLCQRNQWSLTAQHLPGTANDEADALSRMGAAGEYFLNSATTATVMREMEQPPTIDVFASRDTRVLPRYMTRDQFDGGAVAIDGLSASWRGEIVWLHPPLNLILAALTKAIEEGATGVLITPNWRGQPWTPLLDRVSSRNIDLGPFATTTIRSPRMTARGWRLPPGNVTAHFLGRKTT
jgi:ribonuclease HI